MVLEIPGLFSSPYYIDMGVSQNFGGPHNKDYSILGSILGSPYFGNLPYRLSPELPPKSMGSQG